ncbi:hypothetical protein NDU88_006205 [Pleurodeles waltl]|uniref:Uncharacterized protein n=1 Tax=Pleurodeles waltl TaxID=8319 RepID=A0AAV7W9X8_PLEWA|nr:hypothetical protein NDU88_006205 [Pleurodeles waltl]
MSDTAEVRCQLLRQDTAARPKVWPARRYRRDLFDIGPSAKGCKRMKAQDWDALPRLIRDVETGDPLQHAPYTGDQGRPLLAAEELQSRQGRTAKTKEEVEASEILWATRTCQWLEERQGRNTTKGSKAKLPDLHSYLHAQRDPHRREAGCRSRFIRKPKPWE